MTLNIIGQSSVFDKYFNKNEITTINEIITEFDQIIKIKTENNEISKSYLDFAFYLKTADSPEDFYDRMFSIKPEIDSIINKYQNTNFFKNTWFYNHGFRYPNVEDTLSTMLDIDKDSKYIELLKYKKRVNISLKDYYAAYLESLGLDPIRIFDFPYIMETLDMTSRTDRLIIAVHFITIISETKKPAVNKGYTK